MGVVVLEADVKVDADVDHDILVAWSVGWLVGRGLGGLMCWSWD